MYLKDFYYELPEELIARYPTPKRTASRLLSLCGNSGAIEHYQFTDIFNLVHPGDLFVFNDTRVIAARLFGHKSTGGKIEILVERILDNHRVLGLVKASKTLKPDSIIEIQNGLQLKVIARHQELYEMEFLSDLPVLTLLDCYGHMPIPHYMNREDEIIDRERYQTVYAKNPGAVAAPTAGLHFDNALMQRLQTFGVEFAYLTLHVGAGTFRPVRTENICDHKMHHEYFEVSSEVCEKIKATKRKDHRVIAVGTTSVRSLESAALSGEIMPTVGETDIFIYPGYQFHCVDAIITNFHLPESTLLMLVSAFAGHQHVMQAYQAAISKRYRFFSYGDAMFVTKGQ